MKKLLSVSALIAVSVVGFSLSSFTSVFDSNYKVSKTSNLGKLGCAVCHASKRGGKLNAYGEDLKTVLKAEGTKKLTAAALKKVENLDSSKSGKKNIDKIKADLPLG